MPEEILIISEGYGEEDITNEEALIVSEGFGENFQEDSTEEEIEEIGEAVEEIQETLNNIQLTSAGQLSNISRNVARTTGVANDIFALLKLEEKKLKDILGVVIRENEKTRAAVKAQAQRGIDPPTKRSERF